MTAALLLIIVLPFVQILIQKAKNPGRKTSLHNSENQQKPFDYNYIENGLPPPEEHNDFRGLS